MLTLASGSFGTSAGSSLYTRVTAAAMSSALYELRLMSTTSFFSPSEKASRMMSSIPEEKARCRMAPAASLTSE